MDGRIRRFFDIERYVVTTKDVTGYEVEVRAVIGTDKLYCVLDNTYYRESKKRLRTEMTTFYENPELASIFLQDPETLEVGEISVAKIELPSNHSVALEMLFNIKEPPTYSYHRVQVEAVWVDETKGVMARVTFLDDHIVRELSIAFLYHITKEFIAIPSFMVECRLGGLPKVFEGTDMVQRILAASPLPKPFTVVMYVEKIDGEGYPVVRIAKKVDSKMFDLKDHIVENVGTAVKPLECFKGTNSANNLVKICDADSAGQLWLSPPPGIYWALEFVNKFLIRAHHTFLEEQLPADFEFDFNTLRNHVMDEADTELGPEGIYLAVGNGIGEEEEAAAADAEVGEPVFERLSRVRILAVDEENYKITVRHMDYGTRGVYSPQALYPLSVLDRNMAKIPDLAVKIHMDGIRKLRRDGYEKIQKVIGGPNCLVSVKIVYVWSEDTKLSPEAEINFVRESKLGRRSLNKRLVLFNYAKGGENLGTNQMI